MLGESFYWIQWYLDRFWKRIAPSHIRGPRLLAPSASVSSGRSGRKPQILNLLLGFFDSPRSYLEIGASLGHTFEAVQAERRVAVDPFPKFEVSSLRTPKGVSVHAVGSNDFFANGVAEVFDVVYLDASHESLQTYIDTVNSFYVLKPSGVVVIDGVRPSDRPSSLQDLRTSEQEKTAAGIVHDAWFGDVYKTVFLLMNCHPELDVRIIGNSVGQRYCQAVVKLVGEERPKPIPRVSEMIRGIQWEDVFVDEVEPLWDRCRELGLDFRALQEWLWTK